jgi:hypothetical protein
LRRLVYGLMRVLCYKAGQHKVIQKLRHLDNQPSSS